MGGLNIGLVHHPIVGETHIGDAYFVHEGEDFALVAVADGLGHGKDAEIASQRAVTYIREHLEKTPIALLEGCHQALHGTRGAVLAIARIDTAAQTLLHAGLGNIETRIVSEEKVSRPVTVNGIVGHQARKFRQESFAFRPGDLLVMHSDGISDRFEISTLARTRDPQMLANQIAQTHGKDHDDQLLLIARWDA
jgi:serine/threonine protein phosphatase PrpC